MYTDVIADRIVYRQDNTEYLACIVPDTDADNPWDAYGQLAHIWALPNAERWVRAHYDGPSPAVDLTKASSRRYDAAHDDGTAADWLALYRSVDPAGIYHAAIIRDYQGIDVTLTADDDAGANAIVYATAADLRTRHNAHAITKPLYDLAIADIGYAIDEYNAWLRGDVYGWYLLRQTFDPNDPDTCIDSEQIDERYGYYGCDAWDGMYSDAAIAAKDDAANRVEAVTAAMLALDLFHATA